MSASARCGARALPLLALAALASCAEPPLAPGEPRQVDRMVIAPYAMHEECAHLAAGERLDYRYESSAPLDFNIHYHEADAMLAPVVRERSTGDSGIFEARLAQDYCLMWQAGPPGAIIRYRVAVRPSPPR
ncbi:MAG TPA: hypothetical protein VF059_09855 [Casimicrobiaceae bacterium]